MSLITAAVIGTVGAVTGSIVSAHAAGKAADQQAAAAQQAEQLNQPWVNAGQTSLAQLMTGEQNGTFGKPATFAAPTAQEAEATPGYQFAQQQGMRAVTAAGSQAGNSLGGATLKAAEQFGTGLANSTYNDVFNRSLASYNANLSGNQQAYNQLLGVSNQGEAAANNVGNLMTQAGNAQAAGTIGTANAITGGIQGVTSDVSQNLLLSKILAGGAGANAGVTMPSPASLENAGALTVPDVGTFGTATGYGPG